MVLSRVTHIEEDGVSIGVSVVLVDAVESLWELNVANPLPDLRVHQEAHGLSCGPAVVYVMVTVQVQHERRVSKHGRDTDLKSYIREWCDENSF